MTVPRLKSGIWVQAQLRRCDKAGIALTVLRKGDADAGGIILKIVGSDGGARVMAQATAPEGGIAWIRPLGSQPVAEADADAYIGRQGNFDPDIWAIEVMDRDGSFVVDGIVLDAD